MDDLISRDVAIECAINAVDDWDGGWNPTRETVIRRYFEELPAVDAVPVAHGRWILHDDELMPWFECSECGWSFGNAEKFCAGCGAKMDGDQRLAFADQSGAEYADNPTV